MPLHVFFSNKGESVYISQRRGHGGLVSADTPSILNQYTGIGRCRHMIADYEVTDYSEEMISAKYICVIIQADWTWWWIFLKPLGLKLCGRWLGEPNIWIFKKKKKATRKDVMWDTKSK